MKKLKAGRLVKIEVSQRTTGYQSEHLRPQPLTNSDCVPLSGVALYDADKDTSLKNLSQEAYMRPGGPQ